MDGEALRYSGDGLIVSTPIGSTAHSLAAGGSESLGQELMAFAITPVCPHSLNELARGSFRREDLHHPTSATLRATWPW